MATNPLYNTNDSPNNSTQPTKAVNRQGVYVPRTHNTYDNSYFHYKTQKFGQYEPFFIMEGVPQDVIPLHSSHQVRTLPMATPFLSELTLNKDYFMIPNNAIQPNTWDYIYTHPSQGDDVPEDSQNIFNITSHVGPLIGNLVNPSVSDTLKLFSLLSLECFLSSGSLLWMLGYKNSLRFAIDSVRNKSFDDVFDSIVLSEGFNVKFTVIGEDGVTINIDSDIVGAYTAISLLRSYGSSISLQSISLPDISILIQQAEDLPDLRMDRVIAYQLACSQFYVNPQVDFIYNAQLYRDNAFTLLSNHLGGVNIDTFTFNGILVPYDYFSNHYYNISVPFEGMNPVAYFAYINYLFGLRESLRFGDYFTDCRTRPLAISGNGYSDGYVVNAETNTIDVLDFTRNIVFQRFRNAVVKLGNNMADYLRGIMGTQPAPDYHLPKFIAHTESKISGNEVANTTSSGLGELVTNMNSNDDRFAFEVTVDMPCVIIGISSFSIPRLYSRTKEKFFFHKDRYDMFNPMLQPFGDQDVQGIELSSGDEVFGYQSRFGEYKQRYSVASGGFVQKLPAWAFVTDTIFDPIFDPIQYDHQSQSFIRAHDYEFNRFFEQLPGVSLATGFHFIVVYNNKCVSNRPMEVNPSTL